MIPRTTRTTVTFAHPFNLDGFDEPLPAGQYTVEAEDELLEGLSFAAYRRTSTLLLVPLAGRGAAAFEARSIDPEALDAALARDSALAV